ncbi:hypothetical protein ANCCAN_07809 [Ancylostoma caninum]|uniref:Uncharacterized protein n=1 Tax=Ancylostoma caninum TaxID=29170 RepID=A0A368GSY3_ANCCA|nr:hypothetical protein ANCCAN_07809 [Ancylostoma caninum]
MLFLDHLYISKTKPAHYYLVFRIMKVLLLILLWTQAPGTYGEVAFTCDDTGEECPSKMCFYGIDHERSCYRAGCASEEQCAGRRHNECFISNGLVSCYGCCGRNRIVWITDEDSY